jgi:citrate synthase
MVQDDVFIAPTGKESRIAMTNGAASAQFHPLKAGLEDVIVSSSEICFIDGHQGRLLYRGFDVDDLAEQSTFEEVTYLLWHGRLPSRKELDAHAKALASTANRKLPPKVLAMLKLFPKKTPPMEVLRTGVSALSAFDPDAEDNSREGALRKSLRLTAQMPTLVAAWERIRRGKAVVAPNARLNLAGNFLYMLTGKKPTPLAAKTFDIALILHADHEFNASTFAARVTAGTLSDVHSAVVSGIGTLKGPLHGGANEQVMRMVEQIKDPARAEAWIKKLLAEKGRVMGFGHRVYRVADPRAKHLRRLASELGEQVGNTSYVKILDIVAGVMSADKRMFPNVDLYSGAAYAVMGIATDQFTPIFALSRVSGWSAHVLEQHGNNRLIRPRSDYTGPTDAKYVPVAER